MASPLQWIAASPHFRRVAINTVLLLVLCVCTVPAPGSASDLPGEQDYYSADGRLVFSVMPKSEHADVCNGELFALREGRLKLLWRRPLANRFRPGNVLVANDGTVVTLDNLESMGTGDTVVVIYAPDGSKRFNFALEQILSEQEIRETVHSTISSRWWRNVEQDERIDDAGRRVLIATTAGVRAISLDNGDILKLGGAAIDDARFPRLHIERKDETLESNRRYEIIGRLECLADCNNRDNWFIHLRPGKKYPQRLRLTVPDVTMAKKVWEKNIRAIVHVERSGSISSVRAYADSLTTRKSVSMKELFETPLRAATTQK